MKRTGPTTGSRKRSKTQGVLSEGIDIPDDLAAANQLESEEEEEPEVTNGAVTDAQRVGNLIY